VADQGTEVIERKVAFLRQFLTDLASYAQLDSDGRRREHYAIERLLQLLFESAADIGLQVVKRRGVGLAGSYREVFTSLQQQGALPQPLAERLHVHVLDYEDYH